MTIKSPFSTFRTPMMLEPLHPTNDANIHGRWIDNHAFWRNLPGDDAVDELYSISDIGVSEQSGTFYTPNVSDSSNNSLLLISDDVGILRIQNLETRELTTIAQTPTAEMISANWYADGLLTVTVWQEGQTLGRWRVRVRINTRSGTLRKSNVCSIISL
ncbi:MAG: hypothetical protein U0694_07375 [Anaerolineae bacterium]